jgi:hypothetical protein
MKRLSYQTLLFAILSLTFIVLITFLSSDFPPYPLASYQDAFDILTPLVLIPIYWLLFKSASAAGAKRSEEFAFMVLSALWVLGQGIHLSANSIDNLIGSLTTDMKSCNTVMTEVYRLTYFYDEHLGHILWHLGVLGLAALLVYREWRKPSGQPTVWWAVIVAGLIYGFIYFAIFLEGQTLAIGYPFSAIFVAFTLVSQRKNLGQRPVLAFFFLSCLLAFILFSGWGLYWGAFPQPSEVGIP